MTFYSTIGTENIAMSYSSPTFTIKGLNGRDLSASNPGYVVMSSATAGQLVRIPVIANQDFIDDGGASEILNNLFGYTTSVAITVDVPFFLYAVSSDDETAVAFMLSRQPHRQISPATASIGAPDDAVADTEISFWSLDNITETSYDTNPCMCIGSFRMQMSSSDDWTVQALSITDGIGLHQEGIDFTQPQGQFGSTAGTTQIANGGTIPAFSSNASFYNISKDGYVKYNMFMSSDAGANGAGAVVALLTIPYIPTSAVAFQYGTGFIAYGGAAGFHAVLKGEIGTNTCSMQIDGTARTSGVLWSAFINGDRQIAGSIYYKLSGT